MKAAFILLVAVAAAVAASESNSSRYIFYQRNYRLPFMWGVTPKGKAEYSNIIYGRNLTLAQEQEKIAAWAKKYNRTEQVKKFRAESDASFKQLEQRIIKVFESLPATFQEYLKILKSADKTMAEIKKEVRSLYKKNKKVFSAMDRALASFNDWPRNRFLPYRGQCIRIRPQLVHRVHHSKLPLTARNGKTKTSGKKKRRIISFRDR